MADNQPKGYLATPASRNGSPVLVLHAWWGLNDTIKGVCDRLANEGYLAFAPDLYQGKVATTQEDAKAFANSLNDAEAFAILQQSVKFLNEKAAGNIAVIGFSLGAYFALEMSNRDPEHIQSVIVFYGTGPEDFSKSKAAYQGHFAEKDPFESKEDVANLEILLQGAGRPVDFYTYPGTGHWFFEPDVTAAYDEAAATLAWERTLSFLKQQFSE